MSFGPVCQQCKEPLQIDGSLIDLAPSAYDMIVASLPSSSTPISTSNKVLEQSDTGQGSPSKAAWHHAKSSSKSFGSNLSSRAQGKQAQRSTPLPNESFVLLQDSIIRNIPSPIPSPTRTRRSTTIKPKSTPTKTVARNEPQSRTQEQDHADPSPLSHHLRSTARLFNLLSTRTDIDHPLCAECTQILLTNLQRKLDETKKERDGYIAFEKEVRKEKEKEAQTPFSKEETERRIERLKQEEAIAIEQLKEAEREREQLDFELQQLETSEKALELEEAEFWQSYNDHTLGLEHQASQLAALRAAYVSGVATLEKLERTNVYNDAFCIGHDGVFGTINGLRLGRVPGIPVEWAEINAAWGQTLLLLYTIARKLDYTFENYRLVPMGSFSRIEKTTGDKANYELYGSGDLHFGRLLHNRRFDIAMVAFLDCLKHLMDHVKSQDSTVDFPHQISKDKIGDVSVKLQFNQEEAWTRSLRHVLLALKICLKWATNGANG
ncbi:Vacuolar protein sorting-associated protein 30 [Psilocybe cubensis]|uniref:Vacuolar protein sorting-associated protein 30 n=2 Tax=Psilocybe cubensis TaxID=181762 RepID=A0ACB8HCP2_PSICU|nr:Vacuolar protein sorting-associated protein 30 [Psilocybe cubensis]KAH9485563.1 Vacuolar protein sorting-associated protein 30 [Psilocybe cubensis]